MLIDEFQDTDPVQWQVFQRAFSETTTMVLIGDPKQAIYAFRGGDIVTYLQAAQTATTVQTLGVNWRSDGPLLESVHAVLRDRSVTADAVRQALAGSGLAVTSIAAVPPSLEDVFLDVVDRIERTRAA